MNEGSENGSGREREERRWKGEREETGEHISRTMDLESGITA